MERSYLLIFKPDNKFKLTPNWIVSILWTITIAFFWAFDSILPSFHTLKTIWLILVLLITIGYLISSFFLYNPLNGILDGKIEFEKDRIIINDQAYELKNINKLDFALSDYYGMSSTTTGANFNPRMSQGVSNSVTFTDDKDQPQLIYFKLEGKHGFLYLAPLINEAVKLGKISYYRATDLIGEENVPAKY